MSAAARVQAHWDGAQAAGVALGGAAHEARVAALVACVPRRSHHRRRPADGAGRHPAAAAALQALHAMIAAFQVRRIAYVGMCV